MQIGAAEYYLIQCATEQVPWHRIRRVIDAKIPMVLGDGMTAPEGVLEFQGNELCARAVENSALAYLNANRVEKATLVDYSAEAAGLAEKLLRYVRQLRVVTDQADAYTGYAMDILMRTGAALLISRDIRASADSSVIIAPRGIHSQVFYNRATTVFTGRPDGIVCENMRTPRALSIPYSVRSQFPQGIEPQKFACALYELCGLEELAACQLDIKGQIDYNE
ncbi:MAG: hypothetical protein LIO46_00670 [Clostridiales bacterium]|nr:hypothetical protein [Clostridiales bacterium]